MAVFRSIDAFVGRSALLSWIYGIAKNTVNNHLRRTRAQELRIERAEDELVRNAHSFEACSPEEHVNYRRCADAALRSLESVSDGRPRSSRCATSRTCRFRTSRIGCRARTTRSAPACSGSSD